MQIGKILQEKQPKVYNRLNKQKEHSKKRGKKEYLSFNSFKNLMKHDSYRRGRGGAIRQVSCGI